MKKLVYNISFFLFIPIIIIILFKILYLNKIDNIIDNYSVVICGDSHTNSGIDNCKLKNSINISNSSETYFYTFNILNKIAVKKSKPKTIVLGCSFHSFGKGYDFDFDKDFFYSESMLEKYFLTLDFQSSLFLFTKKLNGISKVSVPLFFQMFQAVSSSNKSLEYYPFIGKRHKSNKSNLCDSVLKSAIKTHYYGSNSSKNGFSYSQKKYLIKIVNLCKMRGFRLILVNTPVHRKYHNKIPKKVLQNYYTFINKLNVRLLDLNSFKIESKYMGDFDHLNSLGASFFTEKLKVLLKNN